LQIVRKKGIKMILNTIRPAVFLSSALLFSGGCDSVRNTLGIDHQSPQEWNAAEPSPGLILPPDYANRPTLPAPRPGDSNPYVVPLSEKARKALLGDAHSPSPEFGNVTQSGESEHSEKEVIDKASESQEVTPNIREIVDEESQVDTTVSGKIISKIKSWKKEAIDNLDLSKSNKRKLENSQAEESE
jgi:hypothetical protein